MSTSVRAAAAAGFSTLLAASTAALAAPPVPPDSSWGKPGVAYDQYRNDAVECARGAANKDVAGTEAAQTLVTASRELDRIADTMSVDTVSVSTTGTNLEQASMIGTAGSYQHAMEKYKPDKQFEAIRTFQYGSLEQCLTERGYFRFQLTKAQARQLRRLKLGSMERRQFLYRLASDPAVLNRQKM